MKLIPTYLRLSILLPTAFMLTHCASAVDQAIENAQFLLDTAKYAEAEAAIRTTATDNPTNIEANFVLASALLGEGVLSSSKTYLGLVSLVLADKTGSETNLATLGRVAPADAATLPKIKEARDLLITMKALVSPGDERFGDVYLQLYVSRLFEIASTITKIGYSPETASDQLCNADHANAMKDGIPDTFLQDPPSSDEMTRLGEDLDQINSDGENAGLPADFALNGRTTDLARAFVTATAGTDIVTGATNFLKDQLGYPLTIDTTICVIPK